MSEYVGKSDQQIIAEQEASLNAKSDRFDASAKFQPTKTSLSEESGVNESGVEGFPGASVSVGRTGQTGGGANPQFLPEEEGGLKDGSSSAMFDDVPAGDDKISYAAKTAPGSLHNSRQANEALRSADAPADGQPQLMEDQSESKFM